MWEQLKVTGRRDQGLWKGINYNFLKRVTGRTETTVGKLPTGITGHDKRDKNLNHPSV